MCRRCATHRRPKAVGDSQRNIRLATNSPIRITALMRIGNALWIHGSRPAYRTTCFTRYFVAWFDARWQEKDSVGDPKLLEHTRQAVTGNGSRERG